MCLNVSAAEAGNAISCMSAAEEGSAYQDEQMEVTYFIMDLSTVEDINSLPAGNYIDIADENKWYAEMDAYNSFIENFIVNCTNGDDSWGQSCGCQEKYNAWVLAVNDFEAVIKVSDGSSYVEPDGPCTPGDSENEVSTKPTSNMSSDSTVENVVKTPENDLNTFMDASVANVNRVFEQISQAVAAGDTQKAQSLRTTGVMVDTGVWYSYNLTVYEQIEKAGIPVTLTFTYEGRRWKVTIPAGAKVTELCDENGWCGFLNLAAHYGFEWL